MASAQNRSLWVGLLIAAAIGVLVVVFYSPIWWVSLTAPNYPTEAFPDGVRIHFHLNGVFNGCKKVEKTEIQEEEALDCVHEMDTINHYVGMYPIAAGGVVERAFSPFLIALLGVMLLGFMFINAQIRSIVLAVGFITIAVWMYLTWYSDGGLKLQSSGYISALVTALDQDTEKESAIPGSGSGIIERLRQSLAESGVGEQAAMKKSSNDSNAKSDNIEHLRATFDRDQERKPVTERQDWDGSSGQMLSWHYEKSLGRYFNNPAEIKPMVKAMTTAGHVIFWGILTAMVLLLVAGYRTGGFFYWLLILVPLALPLFFIIEYSAWLWWYGHNLNEMGAFTVKAFMPTVFGDGKVAQFTTHSYPYYGFALMLVFSVLLAVAARLRRGELKEQTE